MPRWLYSFAHEHDAIVVSPDYRLLPEATAEELLDDLDDFWAWLSSDLPSVARDVSAKAAGAATATGLEVDLGRVIVHGESAGGYCAIQMVLSNFKPQTEDSPSQTPRIRALISVYPMCDFRHRHWTEAYLKDINGALRRPPRLHQQRNSASDRLERRVHRRPRDALPRRRPAGTHARAARARKGGKEARAY